MIAPEDTCTPSGIRRVPFADRRREVFWRGELVPAVPGSLVRASLDRSTELARARGVVASLRRGEARVPPRAYPGHIAEHAAFASLDSGTFLALLLRRHVRSAPILAWAVSLGGLSCAEAWAACPRGDWLVHIARALSVEWRSLVRAAVAAARHALPLGTGPRHLQYLLGHLEALLNEDPRDFGPDDRELVLRSVEDADFDDLRPGAERAVYWAAKAYATYLGVLAESGDCSGETFRSIVTGAVENAVLQDAAAHGAAVDEEGDIDWTSPEVAAAQARVADVVRGVLTCAAMRRLFPGPTRASGRRTSPEHARL